MEYRFFMLLCIVMAVLALVLFRQLPRKTDYIECGILIFATAAFMFDIILFCGPLASYDIIESYEIISISTSENIAQPHLCVLVQNENNVQELSINNPSRDMYYICDSQTPYVEHIRIRHWFLYKDSYLYHLPKNFVWISNQKGGDDN